MDVLSRGEYLEKLVDYYCLGNEDCAVFTLDPYFLDVPTSTSYFAAVQIAADLGVLRTDVDYFSPEKAITQSEALKILLELFVDGPVDGKREDYTDVLSTDWYAAYVRFAVDFGLLSGEGVFAPVTGMTRGTLVEWMAYMLIHHDELPLLQKAAEQWQQIRSGNLTQEVSACLYADAKFQGDLSATATQNTTLRTLRQSGKTFDVDFFALDPDASVLRGEVVALLLQGMCERFLLAPLTEGPFPDVSLGHANALFIGAAKKEGVVTGYAHDGLYRPEQPISQGEVLKVMLSVFFPETYARFEIFPTDPLLLRPGVWYTKPFSFAVRHRLLSPELYRTLPISLDAPATREWIAELLVKLLDLEKKGMK
jgi:hypothetical protein